MISPGYVVRQKLPALERPQVRKAIKFAKRRRADNLLDIGCADGEITAALKTALGAKDVYGIEIIPKYAEAAMQRGIKVFDVDVDFSDIPLQSSSCEAVFCGEIIEHLINVEHLLDEIHRVLKPGGFCILTTPNLACWYNRLALLAGFQTYATWIPWGHFLAKGPAQPRLEPRACRPHISVMTIRALGEVISLHNLKVTRLEGACARGDVLSFRFAPLFFFFDEVISRIPSLAAFIVMEMEKERSDLR